MALWAARNTGILFGGVTDEDTSEETLDSIFHNDLYVHPRSVLYRSSLIPHDRNGYQISGNGRWFSMALKKPKKKGGVKKKPTMPQSSQREVRQEDRNDDSDDEQGESISDDEVSFLDPALWMFLCIFMYEGQ